MKPKHISNHTETSGAVALETLEEDDAGGVTVTRSRQALPPECVDYENLLRSLEEREPSEEDFAKLEEHESSCTSALHSEAGVEQALGLPSGALRKGSPEDGLKSPRELIDELIDKHLKVPV